MGYQIVTDTGANLLPKHIKEFGVHVLPLSFFIDGEEFRSYVKDVDIDLKEFYDKMRNDKVITTSLPHLDLIQNTFTEVLESGDDLLYLGFSSGISGTYQAGENIANQLRSQYPNRTIVTIDTLSAAMGQGLLVYYALDMKRNGSSLQEVAEWVEEYKLKLAHWFTVDDLKYLYRGGRVSRTSAFAAGLLNIKPVLHVDDEGKLIPMEKVRGRKKSIQAMVGHMKEKAITPVQGHKVFISHGDCPEDVDYLVKLIRKEWGDVEIETNILDPVIGAHSGPGTLALFFFAEDRN